MRAMGASLDVPAGHNVHNVDLKVAVIGAHVSVCHLGQPQRRRRKFTTSTQLAKAYEDESVMIKGFRIGISL